MTPEKQAEIKQRAELAGKAMGDVATDFKSFRMSIPVHEQDTDILIGTLAFEDVPALLDALTEAQDALTAAEGEAGRLRAALAGVIKAIGPQTYKGIAKGVWLECIFCDGFTVDEKAIEHNADCPFVLAKALLAGEE